jgi:hypothetical protein
MDILKAEIAKKRKLLEEKKILVRTTSNVSKIMSYNIILPQNHTK